MPIKKVDYSVDEAVDPSEVPAPPAAELVPAAASPVV